MIDLENNYWFERAANNRVATYHKDSDKTIQIITRAYDKAIKDINEDISKMIKKFSKDGNLTVAEARAMLNTQLTATEINNLKQQANSIADEEAKSQLITQINSQAYRARITRKQALKHSIYIKAKQIAAVEIRESAKQYIKTINHAYYRNIFDLQQGIGIGFNVASMPVKKVEQILKNPWSGKHFSQRIWHNTTVLADKLNEVITSGFMSGKSSRVIARELKEHTDYGKYAAERLVRTEVSFMSGSAELESYNECDIEEYIFVATLDLRTSKPCRKLDRKVFKVSEAEPGKNYNPMHPFCRSTTRAKIGPDTLKAVKRRARDPVTGKSYLVPADMNYKEWHEKYVVGKFGKEDATILQNMIQHKGSDKSELKALKSVLGKDLKVKSFNAFQDLKYRNREEYKLIKADYLKRKQLLETE